MASLVISSWKTNSIFTFGLIESLISCWRNASLKIFWLWGQQLKICEMNGLVFSDKALCPRVLVIYFSCIVDILTIFCSPLPLGQTPTGYK